ncbi:unnamed protein product, partial [Closterium sp. NIES-54]
SPPLSPRANSFCNLCNRCNLINQTPHTNQPHQVTTEAFLSHVKALLSIPGARLEFGGKELQGGKHSIPTCYGAVEPTAVFVPLKAMLASRENFEIATKEVFGPIQVVREYDDSEVDPMLEGSGEQAAQHSHLLLSAPPLHHPFNPQVVTGYDDSEIDLVLEGSGRQAAQHSHLLHSSPLCAAPFIPRW